MIQSPGKIDDTGGAGYSTEKQVRCQAIRMRMLADYVAAENMESINVFKAFMDTGRHKELLENDVHPNAEGSALWFEKVKQYLVEVL